MLPKSSRAKSTTDFRPIANVRVPYKLFTYMILTRIEDTLDNAQPEEQHVFRKHRRIEEHLFKARYVVDTTEAANLSVWIISLDLSKNIRPDGLGYVMGNTCWPGNFSTLALEHTLLVLCSAGSSDWAVWAQHTFEYSCRCSARLSVEPQVVLQCSTARNAQMEKPTCKFRLGST